MNFYYCVWWFPSLSSLKVCKHTKDEISDILLAHSLLMCIFFARVFHDFSINNENIQLACNQSRGPRVIKHFVCLILSNILESSSSYIKIMLNRNKYNIFCFKTYIPKLFHMFSYRCFLELVREREREREKERIEPCQNF